MDDLERFKDIIIKNGSSVTKTRLMLFHTLKNIKKPAKISEIATITPTVNKVSVYRTLELFSRLNITETSIQGRTLLVELAGPFRPHRHRIICLCCSKINYVESKALEETLQHIASQEKYTLEQHTVELSGLCRSCQSPVSLP